VTKFESENWLMPMAFHKLGRGTLELRGMFSLEPLTFSGAGSPQLFRTGETYRGRPLVDSQHPHDLFMELSATYTLPVGERGTWYAYAGMPGEPALGPVAFTLNFLDRDYAYTRLELADREGLLSDAEARGLGLGSGANALFRVGAYTFGGARDLWRTDSLSFALGGDFTFYSEPAALGALYGRGPTSYKIFLRIRPGKTKRDGRGAHEGHAGHGGG
jgi:hypothetical protein